MPSGHPHGMTVSSFTSVSIRPPLILVCIDQRSGFLADLASGQYIGVNVLSEAQQSLAVRFATVADEGRFSGVPWNSGLEGIPMLAGTVAAFACSVQNLVPAGDHVILVARPEQIHRHGGNPLVWCHSSYHCLPGSVL
jgi:flavin reductase (DIM6/NTAB) family NADH-FMN oxidoreductase RutF